MAGLAVAIKPLAAAVGSFLVGQGAAAVVARLAISIAVSYALAKRGFNPGLSSRGVTLRGTVEPQAKIYGQAQVSGPVFWNDAAGRRNSELWVGVVLAGHEVTSITDIWLDDNRVTNSQINGGAAAGGAVSSGKYAPINGNDVLQVWKHLGTSTQAANSSLVSAFSGWTSAHRLRGLAYIAVRMRLWDKSEKVWPRAPQNYRALVNGAKVYDPRLDSTQTGLSPAGSGAHRYSDPTTWAWSDNPALCVADYLIDTRFGMGLDPSRIDWQSVLDAADHCEGTVAIPTSSTEQRFTCNGVVYGTTTHRENLAALLSSMNGEVTVSGGQWYVHAGEYQAPADSFTADDVVAPLAIRANRPRGERVNTLRAVFIDPDRQYKATETPPVYTAALRARDDGQVLERELDLPFTNSPTMAQRLLWKQLHVADLEHSVQTVMSLKAATVKIGDRANLTVDELAWSPKVFKVDNWRLIEAGDELGVEVDLREDASSAYADPAEGNYSTVSAAGVISFASEASAQPEIPAAQPLSGANLQNPTFETRMPGANRPAGWYTSSSNTPAYEGDGTNDVRLSGVFVSTAFRVDPRKSYRVTVVAKGTIAMANAMDINADEYDSELDVSGGKYAIAGAINADDEIQIRTRILGLSLNNTLTTAHQPFEAIYYPTATAKWASINLWDSGVAGAIVARSIQLEEMPGLTVTVDPPGLNWDTYEAGGWSPADTTRSVTVRFWRGGTQVASRVLNATLTDSGANEGDIAVAAGTSTGDTTGVSLSGNNSPAVLATVTHSDSGVVTYVSFGSALPGYSGGPTK